MLTPLAQGEFAELDRLFHEAVELTPQDRSALIERVRGGSPSLAERLVALLSADGDDATLRGIVA